MNFEFNIAVAALFLARGVKLEEFDAVFQHLDAEPPPFSPRDAVEQVDAALQFVRGRSS